MTRLLLAITVAGSPGAPLGSSSELAHVRCTTPYEAEIDAAVDDVSSVWTVPRALVKAVIQRESAYDPSALSRAGAVGLMQVLPRNAAALGVAPEKLWLPKTNVLAGTRLLAILLRHYQGDVIATLTAYNARPRRLFAPPPKNGETGQYVLVVLARWKLFERCSNAA
jgi:soluble lytic murein transglycosylase-like protein